MSASQSSGGFFRLQFRKQGEKKKICHKATFAVMVHLNRSMERELIERRNSPASFVKASSRDYSASVLPSILNLPDIIYLYSFVILEL
jgi:hypothetical protein